MKVYIGPYRNWIGPYQIADKIFFWVDRTGIYADEPAIYSRWDYRAAERFGEWLSQTWVKDLCNWLASKMKRKVKVRIDYYDTWSMDHTLAIIIHPMLVQLKETNHGYFNPDVEDVPHIGQDPDTDFTDDPKAIDRYSWVMDELIWTFEQLLDDENEFQFYKDGEWDSESYIAYQDRIKNGLRLFGRYYRALWD